VQVEAEATNIPEYFEVSVEGAEVGTQVLASQLDLPEGVTLLSDEELLIVNVIAQVTEEQLEAELEEAEAEAGIEREESEDEAAEGEGAEGAETEGGEGALGGDAPAESADDE
jgi:large subunit ribosomal protein L25